MTRNPFEEELERRKMQRAKDNLLEFTQFTYSKFTPNWFHQSYYKVLQDFADGKITHLMVFVPPQHGKSEGSTRRLPAFMLGKDPDLKFGIVSYSAPKARKFNREIQRIITEDAYRRLFPDTRLWRSNVATVAQGTWLRNADECEIVGHRGSFKTVGVGGPLTGESVDILIIDDIYKDAKSAWSPVTRETIQDWYNTVADSRLHNNSQVLVVFTRWHEDDLGGYLLKTEGKTEDGGKWNVLTYPAIKEGPPNAYDPRRPGEPLWPERHAVAKLLAIKKRDKRTFASLYQQNPKPIEGLMYKSFRTYKQLPAVAIKVKAVIDTADTGDDWLCSIVYSPTPEAYYIRDIVFSQDGMEVTEDLTARQLSHQKVQKCRVESNNGGRSFARKVEEICRRIGNTKTQFGWYHQSNNKEIRIFTYAADVQNMIFYPEDWEARWPQFAEQVKGYLAAGKNAHDDGPDALTMIIEAEAKRAEITEGPPDGNAATQWKLKSSQQDSEAEAIKSQYYT